MPRLQIDYSKTIIYKIVCKNINIKECYVGETTDFTKRKCCHKSRCNNINDKKYNIYVYKFIRENGGWVNFDMVEIEKYNAIDKLDAGKRERYWVEQLQATLNQQLPTRTNKEYYDGHKEYFKEHYQEYRNKNKEHKQKLDKDYYEQNKDKILENMNTKITCICGSICSKSHLRRHERTNKHIEFVKTI